VLHGLQPSTGEVIVRTANGPSERRAGWDATFNAPKSVSIQALVDGDARFAEAHRAAVTHALAELERYALSRQRGGSEWVVTENIVAARFDHIAARPARGADDGYGPDPHLHTHVVIANMTRRPDGQWRGLNPVEIYRSQAFASAVYRSELAREVQNLGYRIDVTGADGRWELGGYTREQVMAFSRRRHEIEVEMERQGLNGAAAAQNIAHQSRLSKDVRSEDQLRAEWQTRAEFATVAAIDHRKCLLRLDGGREVTAAVQRLRHIDYGYASTSHSSQGSTVDRVIVHVETNRSPELVNRKQFYVSVRRARHAVSLYTDDRARLSLAVGRNRETSLALEHVRPNLQRGIKVIPERALHNLHQGHGMRR
jgi:conjugative relaxase-like TrwC/TraI family protein